MREKKLECLLASSMAAAKSGDKTLPCCDTGADMLVKRIFLMCASYRLWHDEDALLTMASCV